MAKRRFDPNRRAARRQFLLMNAVGQLGRQGVLGPAEKFEKKQLGIKGKKTIGIHMKPKGV